MIQIFLFFLTGFLIVSSARASEEIKPQLKCFSAIFSPFTEHQVSSTPEAQGCRTKQGNLVFLAERYTRKGMYFFDVKSGELSFTEFVPAPAEIFNSEIGSTEYMSYTLFVKQESQKIIYTATYVDKKKPPHFGNKKTTVSEQEVDLFIKKKHIPKDVAADIRDRIKNYIASQKKKSVDPNSPEERKRLKFEAVTCHELDAQVYTPNESIEIRAENAEDNESKNILNSRLHKILGKYYVDPNHLEVLLRSDEKYKENLEKIANDCSGVHDPNIQHDIASIKTILEKSTSTTTTSTSGSTAPRSAVAH